MISMASSPRCTTSQSRSRGPTWSIYVCIEQGKLNAQQCLRDAASRRWILVRIGGGSNCHVLVGAFSCSNDVWLGWIWKYLSCCNLHSFCGMVCGTWLSARVGSVPLILLLVWNQQNISFFISHPHNIEWFYPKSGVDMATQPIIIVGYAVVSHFKVRKENISSLVAEYPDGGIMRWWGW